MEIKYSNPKNKYDIICRIGSGTYGEVFKASHLLTGKMYALKSIKVEKDEDFCQIKNEIDVINQCRHKNVVNIYEAFLNRSRLWMCMEICDGGSLQDVLEDIGSLPELMIAYVIRESIRGLEYIHSCGQIHRDIKGGNILLNSQGEVKLADFGIAASLSKTIAKRCSVLGTPYWMAPEVISAQRTGGYGKSCDIWSIGITAIELADTEPPLYDLHPVAALHLIGKSSYKSPTMKDPSKWSSDFVNFVKKTLNKNVRWRLTAKECLNQPFLRNASLSQQFGLALYNSRLNKLKRNGENTMVDHTPDLEQEIDSGFTLNVPRDQTITEWSPKQMEHFKESDETLKDTLSLDFNEDLSLNITENGGLCYAWDWRKQIKQIESIGIPRIASVIMGAGLSKIYENCELDVTCSELWVNSETSEQNILLGSKDGVYLGNLMVLGEFIPKKIFYKPCTWLHVNMYEVVLVISSVGTIPYLFTIDMMNLCKSGFEVNKSSKLSDIFSFKNKKTNLFNKVEETKDIEKCVAFRSSISCEDCLLCTLHDQVVLMQWFLPYRRYMLIKRIMVGVPKGISFTNEPLLTLDKAYPYLCFGVSYDSEMNNNKSLKYDYVDLNLHTGWGAFKDNSNVTCNTLKAIFIGQLTNDTVVVGFEKWAGVYSLEGLLTGSEILTFDAIVQDYVIISDGLLAIHKHGVIGKSYENKLIQNIYDPSRVFTLLGSKGFMVLKTVDEWETVDLHVLTGYDNMP